MFGTDAMIFGITWKERIQADPLATRVFAALWPIREILASSMTERIRDENPLMGELIKSHPAETAQHILTHFHALLALPTELTDELESDPFAFVRAHGVYRARSGIPLLAVLQAYRMGHQGCWGAMRDMIIQLAANAEDGLRTSMLLSDYCIEYTDLVSTTLTEAYLSEQALVAAQSARTSIAVVGDLLRGEAPRTPETRALCQSADIGDGRSMVVLVAKRVPLGNSAPFSAHQRGALVRAVESALPRSQFGRLVDLGLDELVAVVSSSPSPGVRTAHAIRAQMSEILAATGPSLRAGIGLDVCDIRALPQSYTEALSAIRILGAHHNVCHLADVRVDAYLRSSADATAQRLASPWAGALRAEKHSRTLQAFADASLNIKECAHILDVHNNTIYHRLNRIEELTGVDPRTYEGLTHLLTVLAIAPSELPTPSVAGSSPPGARRVIE
jgi:sugar diacid utilization regulator